MNLKKAAPSSAYLEHMDDLGGPVGLVEQRRGAGHAPDALGRVVPERGDVSLHLGMRGG